MSETLANKKIFTLSEVTRSIQKTLHDRYTSVFWVKAEMNKLNHYPHSGHCYPELVEKTGGKIVAELKSVLWKDDFVRINKHFLQVIREPLKNGINILIMAKISFDPVYGLSLRIIDIDPGYSLGELEREKMETIRRLQSEGVWEMNRQQKLAVLPKRIAIISVETSKGYSDFIKVVDSNPWSYKFFHMLFPAVLQGDRSVQSILLQLRRIARVTRHFDAVAIIRGGGGDVGLTCYNDYSLSNAIAQFPLPVITGIGHSTNETVCELVAYKNAITPTELGDFLLQQFHNFSVPVQQAGVQLGRLAINQIAEEKSQLYNAVRYFRSVSINRVEKNKRQLQLDREKLSAHIQYQLDHLMLAVTMQSTSLRKSARYRISLAESNIQSTGVNLVKDCRAVLQRERNQYNQFVTALKKESPQVYMVEKPKIENLKSSLVKVLQIQIRAQQETLTQAGKTLGLLDPLNLLKRGYSITMLNGKLLRSVKDAKQGDTIQTILPDGELISKIERNNGKNE